MTEAETQTFGGTARELLEGSIEIVWVATEAPGEGSGASAKPIVRLDPCTLVVRQLATHW